MIYSDIVIINYTNCYRVNLLLLFAFNADGLWLLKELNKLYILSIILIVDLINVFIDIIQVSRFYISFLILMVNKGIKNNV